MTGTLSFTFWDSFFFSNKKLVFKIKIITKNFVIILFIIVKLLTFVFIINN